VGLPAERRLRRGADITAVVRGGSRARSGGLVVHALHREDDTPARGPRVAFIAPRTVGNAVVRNRTRRRLQSHVHDLNRAGALGAEVDLVLRLLPAGAGSDHDALGVQLRRGLQRLGVLTGEHP